ncbi:HPP family protein [Flavobacterium faecale]|uniref:HPP family protein n=1 Tax=Flavobacterium faecale TaxID=1355330 RepID=A0A2S1LDG9_9FLAO|nr:HPP family protein [Flavobacterium faecale]AWG21812.1 HPP family protein [Flavobacterium faecale]
MPTQYIKKGYQKTKYIIYKETLIDFREQFWSFVGSFIGIGCIAYFHAKHFPGSDGVYLIGSFGASSVLLYGIIQSPFSQPRNLIGGHVISAIIGVTIQILLPEPIWLAAPLAVSLSVIAMQMTKTLHPPGGATALIAIIGTEKIKTLGYWYVLSPVLAGCLILLFVALIVNNVTERRSYPSNNRFHRNYHTFRKKLAQRQQ